MLVCSYNVIQDAEPADLTGPPLWLLNSGADVAIIQPVVEINGYAGRFLSPSFIMSRRKSFGRLD